MNNDKKHRGFEPHKNVITEITGLYSVPVFAEVAPRNATDVCEALIRYSGPVSIGGGRYSMGGQVASENSLHLDMRHLNAIGEPVIDDKGDATIVVGAGATWKEIQRKIDPHDLSLSIMQTYSNFTVAGSLSVNVHGRYVGMGALIHSVIEIEIVLADGRLVTASRSRKEQLFRAAIGGYGGFGVIVSAKLKLAKNTRVERFSKVMELDDYLDYFQGNIAPNREIIFHNANIYPPHFRKVRAISWRETELPVTQKDRLNEPRKYYPLQRYFTWSILELPAGHWRRENVLEPIYESRQAVHWRNYEAGYDVAELEPASREKNTYVLQEYFVPVRFCAAFVKAMAKIVNAHGAKVLNVSIRHAKPDTESYLSWSREEVFAFVLYYKQGTDDASRTKVGVWTRELIDAALKFGGAYYLPYQVHGTFEQFKSAYPGWASSFAAKKRYDPNSRFKNVIWDTYYTDQESQIQDNQIIGATTSSVGHLEDFAFVMESRSWRDQMYHFLQNVYGLYPADKLFNLIDRVSTEYRTDEAIYKCVQSELGTLTNPLYGAILGLKALAKQKREMKAQTRLLIGDDIPVGYLEIGSKGRYFRAICRPRITKHLHFVEERPVGYSPLDIIERGAIERPGHHHDLGDYRPLSTEGADLDMITCYVGLHHAPPQVLKRFVESIARSLRAGGIFILREHDAVTPEMKRFVSLIHTVFNMGLKEDWRMDSTELRNFQSLTYWIELLKSVGLEWGGGQIFQEGDPSMNALMLFRRIEVLPS
ncbi:FAD-binding protein [Pseudomonas syringae pv. actinidiae]|nr:FAD-binding protein [Pseudomonas syringae pv. actinidiae]